MVTHEKAPYGRGLGIWCEQVLQAFSAVAVGEGVSNPSVVAAFCGVVHPQGLADCLTWTNDHERCADSRAIALNTNASAVSVIAAARGAFVKLHGDPDLGDTVVVDFNTIPVFDSDFAASTVTWAIAASGGLECCGTGTTLYVD